MDVFEAIAEPSRREVLDLLAERERPAGELVDHLHRLTQPAVSRHLRILREVGLVDVRPEGQKRIYRLRAERLVEVEDWISRYRRYWPQHLDALETHLTDNPEEPPR
jgi:DNA-binding transcriptional ArsR family regulator